MKPIETIYKGFWFRSRLEARWAVFFDTLGIKWEYEKEGYDLGKGTLYLPDFYIPHLDCWIEVKGEYPGEKEEEKYFKLATQTNKNVYLFVGQIEPPLENREGNESGYLWHPKECWDNNQWWCQCRNCGKFGIEYEGRGSRICDNEDRLRYWNPYESKIEAAYSAARKARFEYAK